MVVIPVKQGHEPIFIRYNSKRHDLPTKPLDCKKGLARAFLMISMVPRTTGNVLDVWGRHKRRACQEQRRRNVRRLTEEEADASAIHWLRGCFRIRRPSQHLLSCHWRNS